MDDYVSLEFGTSEFEEFLQHNKGRLLEISLRNLDIINLQKLPSILEESGIQFKKLCLPEGREAKDKDFSVFIELLNFISEELWISEWKLSEDYRKKLQQYLNSRKENITIHISENGIIRKAENDETGL